MFSTGINAFAKWILVLLLCGSLLSCTEPPRTVAFFESSGTTTTNSIAPSAAGSLSDTSISVLAYNVRSVAPIQGVDWRTRYGRVPEWARQNGVLPDIIALTEVHGWIYTLVGQCEGLPPFEGLADYDAIDYLLERLRAVTSVTYRVAYLTGTVTSFERGTNPRCQYYWSQAMLYNPARLTNLTAQSTAPSAGHNDAVSGSHLRRSLPLCNRGSHLMPLETLIDGPPQTDKCGRQTPSGLAWAKIGPSRILASGINFALFNEPGSTVDVIDVHPDAERDVADAPALREFIDFVTASSNKAHYPPLVVGDFNNLANAYDNYLPRLTDAFVEPPPENWGDTMDITIGKSDSFPARCVPSVAQQLSIPNPPPAGGCGGTPDNLVGDHCAVFVRFARNDAVACGLRFVKIDGPSEVESGHPYDLRATAFGSGPNATYQWEPGGATTPGVSSQAGDPGTEQVWTVTVTDPEDAGKTVTASHTVRAIRDCVANCKAERDACMACDGDGCPLPRECAQQYQACVRRCNRQ